MQAKYVSTTVTQKMPIPFSSFKPVISFTNSPRQKVSQNCKSKNIQNIITLQNKYTYSLEDLIGEGYSSTVYKGTEIQRPNKHYAIKAIEKRKLNQDQMRLIKNEVQLHPKLDHPNITKCFDVFDTPNIIYVVMEWCWDGDLAQFINQNKEKGTSEMKAIQIMEQVIQAYRYLVQQGVLHRDLKPANILRLGNTYKLADFGFAVKGKKSLIDTMSVGTPLYMPPESIQECVYSHKSDFFALGCMMYELLHGKTPWYKNNEKALASFMKTSKIDLTNIKNPNIKHFINKTCEISQGARMSIQEFMEFDFRKQTVSTELTLVRYQKRQISKQKQLLRLNTERQNLKVASNQDKVTAKPMISRKSEAMMQATFSSNHVYFKGAKSWEIKKITAEFQEKFQLFLLLKYLIDNSADSVLIEDDDMKNLKIVLFRHTIFMLRTLLNDLIRTKTFDLEQWVGYKETQEFKLFENDCKMMKQKMQKQLNLQLKGMSLKKLSEINKKFPELNSHYKLPKNFYLKMKQFLKEIISKFHQQIVKKLQKSSSQFASTSSNAKYFEAFKSLYKYYENCDQKLQEDDFNNSLSAKTPTENNTNNIQIQNSLQNSATRRVSNTNKNSINNFAYKIQQTTLGKKESEFNFKNSSPQEYFVNSPRKKQIVERSSEKKGQNFNISEYTTSVNFSQNQNKKNHCLQVFDIKPNKLNYFTQSQEIIISVINPSNKNCFEKSRTNQRYNTVENYFSEILCKNYQDSKMTKDEYVAIKKKLKWLW